MITRITLAFTLSAMLALGCAKNNTAMDSSGGMSTADSMKAAYKAITTAWDAGNVAEFDKYMAQNTVEHQLMPGQAPGLSGVKTFALAMKVAFPDEKTTIDDIRVDSNILVARFSMSGTNSGPMMGMPATNKKMTNVMGMDWVRWENGKFVEHWGLFDDHDMMTQLGLVPPMPAQGNDKKM